MSSRRKANGCAPRALRSTPRECAFTANLAGFGGPYLIGWVKEATDSTSTGLLVLAVLPLIGGLLVFLGGHETRVEFAEAGQRR